MRLLRNVAVLGAGTMGSRIAAHFANAGIPSLLLDIVVPGQPDRDAAAKKGIETAAKQKPGAFFTEDAMKLIRPGNFEDHLGDIQHCDWVIEAVTENLDIKRNLWRRVETLRESGVGIYPAKERACPDERARLALAKESPSGMQPPFGIQLLRWCRRCLKCIGRPGVSRRVAVAELKRRPNTHL